MKKAFPILAVLTAILLGYATYQGLVVAPTERTMGDVQRIFYYHVPSAWTAFLLFFINFLASLQFLAGTNPSAKRAINWTMIAIGVGGAVAPYIPVVQRQLPEGLYPSSVATTAVMIAGLYFLVGRFFSERSLDVLAVTAAEVGVVFCSIVLVTGPLWARPVWGIWWTWDMRLTSTLVLWLIYVSYLFLRKFSSSGQTPVLAAALAILGALCVPFVYFSIWFFRTQHPQPVMGNGGSIDPRMLHVLLLNWLAFSCFAFLVCWSRFRLEVLQREVDEAHAMRSLMDEPGARSRSTR
jgi:heme exporter protein C